jgi:Resolvase, N terminal domain
MTQELGIVALQTRGVTVWAARGEMNLTETDDEFKVAMRQIAAVFAELEKKRLVKKLKQARDWKRAAGVKVEGRKSYAERSPEAVALARRLHRYPKKGHELSLRDIATELASKGHLDLTAFDAARFRGTSCPCKSPQGRRDGRKPAYGSRARAFYISVAHHATVRVLGSSIEVTIYDVAGEGRRFTTHIFSDGACASA